MVATVIHVTEAAYQIRIVPEKLPVWLRATHLRRPLRVEFIVAGILLPVVDAPGADYVRSHPHLLRTDECAGPLYQQAFAAHAPAFEIRHRLGLFELVLGRLRGHEVTAGPCLEL